MPIEYIGPASLNWEDDMSGKESLLELLKAFQDRIENKALYHGPDINDIDKNIVKRLEIIKKCLLYAQPGVHDKYTIDYALTILNELIGEEER